MSRQLDHGRFGLGNKQEAARWFIQPVDWRRSTDHTPSTECRGRQDVWRRRSYTHVPYPALSVTIDVHAGRLVDNGEEIVFVNDWQRKGGLLISRVKGVAESRLLGEYVHGIYSIIDPGTDEIGLVGSTILAARYPQNVALPQRLPRL